MVFFCQCTFPQFTGNFYKNIRVNEASFTPIFLPDHFNPHYNNAAPLTFFITSWVYLCRIISRCLWGVKEKVAS